MAKTPKPPVAYTDMLGTAINENDFVAYPYSKRCLMVGKIVKFTPKMALVKEVGRISERYMPLDTIVKLDTECVLMYMLRENKT